MTEEKQAGKPPNTKWRTLCQPILWAAQTAVIVAGACTIWEVVFVPSINTFRDMWEDGYSGFSVIAVTIGVSVAMLLLVDLLTYIQKNESRDDKR